MSAERTEDRHGDAIPDALPVERFVRGAARDARFSSELRRGHLAEQQGESKSHRIESPRTNVIQGLAEKFRDWRQTRVAGRGWARHVMDMMHNGSVDV